MFAPGRWAEAFINTTGSDAEEALAVFKILVSWESKLPGAVFGTEYARQLEGMIKKAGVQTGVSGSGAFEGALHLIALLVRRNFMRHSGEIVLEIEKLLDKRKNIVEAILETVSPPGKDFEDKIIASIKKRSGATEVRLENRLKPELIGGYRLRIGDEAIDASVRSQLRNMETVLADGLQTGFANGGV